MTSRVTLTENMTFDCTTEKRLHSLFRCLRLAQGVLCLFTVSRKILLVDDSADCRHILALQARAMGYEIVEAETGADGVHKAAKELPDLIVMDLRMPGVDGVEATRRIKADPQTRHIPIIVNTAWVVKNRMEEAVTAGAAMVLTKPDSFGILRDLLQQLQ